MKQLVWLADFMIKLENLSKMKLYIIRHAESLGNLSNLIIENSNLTSHGKEQAKRLGISLKKLKIQKIFSSDLGRTKLTAQIISQKIKKEIVYTELLREKNMGKLFNQSRKKIRKILEDSKEGKYRFRPDSGENMQDIMNRARKFINILKNEKSNSIAIVTHAGFIEAFILELFNLPFEEAKFIQIKPASISTFTFDDKFRTIDFCLGDISHLIKSVL